MIKGIIIVLGFIFIMSGLVVLKLQASKDFIIHGRILVQEEEDWRKGGFENTDFNRESKALTTSLGENGAYLSPPFKTEFPFNEVILTWNCRQSAGAYLTASVRASKDGETWTEWYEIATWPKTNLAKEVGVKRDKEGYIHEDYLVLRQKYSHVQVRFVLVSPEIAAEMGLRSFYLVYTDTEANYLAFKRYSPKPDLSLPAVNLEVPYFSQQHLPDSISGRTCSPTSLAMVMNFHRVRVSPLEVAEKCYDSYNDIYGNWPYNIATAYGYAFRSWADRHSSFGEIAREIQAGFPVVLSIAFAKGELTGSPVSYTEGHLIVARGFTPEGNVICNDPAFHNSSNGVVVYDRDELEKAWTGHHGVAYHLRPL